MFTCDHSSKGSDYTYICQCSNYEKKKQNNETINFYDGHEIKNHMRHDFFPKMEFNILKVGPILMM